MNSFSIGISDILCVSRNGFFFFSGISWETSVDSDAARQALVVFHPTLEWSVQPNFATSTSTVQVPHKYRISSSVINSSPDSKFYTSNEGIIELVRIIGNDELSISQMMDIKKLKHRPNFVDTHLEPALQEKFVRRKYPDRPNHPRQKYLLTVKGAALYRELMNE